MIKEIQIGDLVRIAPNKASYGNQSDIVGLVVALESPEHNFGGSTGLLTALCARVEWINGVKTITGLPVLELVRR